jgi:hypothetical protein
MTPWPGESAERSTRERLADDLLIGAREIGAYIGRSPPSAYRMASTGVIPCGRVGALYVASKKTLDRHFAELTSGGKP